MMPVQVAKGRATLRQGLDREVDLLPNLKASVLTGKGLFYCRQTY